MWRSPGGRIPGRQPMPPRAWKYRRDGAAPVGPNAAAPGDGRRSTRCRTRPCRFVHRSAISGRPRSFFQWHLRKRARQRPLRPTPHWLRRCPPRQMPRASRHIVTSPTADQGRASPPTLGSGLICISRPAAMPVACRWSSGSMATRGATAPRRIARLPGWQAKATRWRALATGSVILRCFPRSWTTAGLPLRRSSETPKSGGSIAIVWLLPAVALAAISRHWWDSPASRQRPAPRRPTKPATPCSRESRRSVRWPPPRVSRRSALSTTAPARQPAGWWADRCRNFVKRHNGPAPWPTSPSTIRPC